MSKYTFVHMQITYSTNRLDLACLTKIDKFKLAYLNLIQIKRVIHSIFSMIQK